MTGKQKLLTVSEAAERLNRRPRTLRAWEREGRLPDYLIPSRDERGNRVFSEDLVEHIREWLTAEGRPNTIGNLRRAGF